MYHDGSNGCRARAARIRTAHDYEATELDSMRRRTRRAQKAGAPRGPIAQIVALFGGLRAAPAEPGAVGATEVTR
jgi:hypothetical protein